ncbi:MAG: TetR/AcrR family transcriptional regulator [Microthrixaceae bacterium]
MGEMVNTGRRARNRAARHSQLVAAASVIVDEKGLDGLTMQEVAERVECAVGTIYTYFESKSSLVAALQANAIRLLAESYEMAASQWDDEFAELDLDEKVESLARIIGFARLFVAWPRIQPREFEFLQQLVRTTGQVLTATDLASVLPMVLALLAEGQVAHDLAVASGAIEQDPDDPADDSTARTIRWIALVQGGILISTNTSNIPEDVMSGAFNLALIADYGTRDLLRSWRADPAMIDSAFTVVDRMTAEGKLLPEPVVNPLTVR